MREAKKLWKDLSKEEKKRYKYIQRQEKNEQERNFDENSPQNFET